MSDSEVLAAELYRLWLAGKVSLPNVAVLYAQASRDMHNTSWREDGAFERTVVEVDFPSFDVVQDLGPVYPHWAVLRSTLQKIMAQTADNLLDAGVALCMIANEYAGGDDEAAAQFRVLTEERLADDGLAQPPTHIPEARLPGDPHDTRHTDVTIDLPILPDIVLEDEVPVR